MEGKIRAHGHYFCSNKCIRKYESRKDPAGESKTNPVKAFLYAMPTLVLIVLLVTLQRSGHMVQFMGWFLVVISLLKVIDWKGFAMAFAEYDLLAKKSRLYAFAYPAIELGLGIAYLVGFQIVTTAAITLVIMLIGSVSVAKNLMEKNKVKCACLGTKIKLPLTKFTLLEDLTMAAMALVILVTNF